MLKQLLLFNFLFSLPLLLWSQNESGILRGTIRDAKTQEPIPFAIVQILGTEPLVGTTSDIDGNYRVATKPGTYNIKFSMVGYTLLVKYNIVLTSGNVNEVSVVLSEAEIITDVVTCTDNKQKRASVAKIETPLSIQSLGAEEIKSNPGGNFDISRVIQVLPGVGGTAGSVGGFRNDIVIRGGAPNENVYYLDGIEIPVINHFSTQGSAGGPVGILNVSFIEDVTLSSSAFEAKYDNALASVFQFKQKEGSKERIQGNVRLSGTELAVTTEGPINKKTTFLASARRSYLQLLFELIGLPIRPNYWDFQTKVTHRFTNKTSISVIGVGAIDEFAFAEPKNPSADAEYIARSQPFIEQWNYTAGVSLKHSLKNGVLNVALSRNSFQNNLDRFEDKRFNDESARLLRGRSNETENKLRADITQFFGGWKVSYGIVTQQVNITNSLFNKFRKPITDSNGVQLQPGATINFNTDLSMVRYGAFGQVGKSFLNNRLSVSAGLRTDMNNFTNSGNNAGKTLSPRVSASYLLNDKWTVSGSVGTYYKLPIYTALSFKDSSGNYLNKSAEYIRSTHYVAGLEYSPALSTRFTLEGFYKVYGNYPVSVRDGISLANQGGDFGAIGNEALISNGKGRTYGFEFYFQQKLVKNLFAVFSYTFVRSEFSGLDGKYVASAWDNRHLISALFGYKLKRNWELGLKYRFAGGAPFTPFDETASRLNYLSTGTGVLNFSQLNSQRLASFNQLDIRVDKKYNFKRVTLDLFLDIQNVVAFAAPSFPRYAFKRTDDNSGFATTDGNAIQADGSNAIPVILPNDPGRPLPTIGFILEF